jgi:hypothetical protein
MYRVSIDESSHIASDPLENRGHAVVNRPDLLIRLDR